MIKILLSIVLLNVVLFGTEFDIQFDKLKTKKEQCELAKEYADKGVGRALYIIGASSYFGDNMGICDVVQDFDISFQYLRKSYDSGYLFSASLLVEHYENGRGTYKDSRLAFQIAEKGYSKGDLETTMQYAWFKCTGYETYKDCTIGKNIMRKLMNSSDDYKVYRAKYIWKLWKFNEL